MVNMVMAQLVMNFIANRRKRLSDLASEKVSSSALTDLLPRKKNELYLIDEKASRVAMELKSCDITNTPALKPGENNETDYHVIGDLPEFAEIPWKVGFRDVNGKNSCNMTSLMNCPTENLFKFIDRRLSKGFEPDLDIEQDRAWYGENANKPDEIKPGQLLETKTKYCKLYDFEGLEESFCKPRIVFHIIASSRPRHALDPP